MHTSASLGGGPEIHSVTELAIGSDAAAAAAAAALSNTVVCVSETNQGGRCQARELLLQVVNAHVDEPPSTVPNRTSRRGPRSTCHNEPSKHLC